VIPPSVSVPLNFYDYDNNKQYLNNNNYIQTHPLAHTVEPAVGYDAVLGFGRQAGWTELLNVAGVFNMYKAISFKKVFVL
jgi:hypothetical protein